MANTETKSVFDTESDAEAEAAADAEIDSGQFVPHDKVTEWLKSWGTPNELQCPKPEPR
jgi:predicted transcriptional regulator